MAHFYFLGGFSLPQDIRKKDLKNYIVDELNVKDLRDIWFDPQHQHRAVFNCTEKLDTERVFVLCQTKTLNHEALFGREEKETDLLYVEVDDNKCKALIDKLPFLFHQRQKGGSKVSDIKQIKENAFKLTFEEGWGAIVKVLASPWSIDGIQIRVTPLFLSFQEDFEAQKQRYGKEQVTKLQQQSESDNSSLKFEKQPCPLSNSNRDISQHMKPNETMTIFESPKPKLKSQDMYYSNAFVLVLLESLSLTTKIKDKWPDVDITIYAHEGRVSIKSPTPLLKKLETMFKKQYGEISDNWKEEFDMFICDGNQENLQRHFQDHDVVLQLEEVKDKNYQLLVVHSNETFSVTEFLFSEIVRIQSIEVKKCYPGFVSEFNEKQFQYKLDVHGTMWNLFHFGRSVDKRAKSSIIEGIEEFLRCESESEAKENVEKTKRDNAAFPDESKPGKTDKQIQNMYLDSGIFVLLKSLSLDRSIQKTCPAAEIIFDDNNEMITLKGKSSDLVKLTHMLFSLQAAVTSPSITAVQSFAHTSAGNFKLILEPAGEKFGVCVQDRNGKKEMFQEFAAQVLNQLSDFSLKETYLDEHEQRSFLEYFNEKQEVYQLIEWKSRWILLKQSYTDCSYLIEEIKIFLNDRSKCSTKAKKHLSTVDLSPFQYYFLSQHSNLTKMESSMSQHAQDFRINEGTKLTFSTNKRGQPSNAIEDYLRQIKAETISLPYKNVKSFYNSSEGQKLFSRVEKSHSCLVRPTDSKGQYVKYTVTPLSMTQRGKIAFHVTQGHSRNLQHMDGSIYICPLKSNAENCRFHIEECGKKADVYFGSKQTKGNYCEELSQNFVLCSHRFKEHAQAIAISFNSNCFESFSYDFLSKLVIDKTLEVFDSGKPVDIFLCEANSVPLLKAFQFHLTGSTTMDLCSKIIPAKVTDLKECPAYSENIGVAKSVGSLKHTDLVCYPIESPLGASPLNEDCRDFEWKYKIAKKNLEKHHPDGLLVAEFVLLESFTCDTALYGCQPWGIDVEQSVQHTLTNCLEEWKRMTPKGTLYIIVPGTAQGCIYPKKWIASKWFENFDKHHESVSDIGTICFVVKSPEHYSVFKDFLNKRKPEKCSFFESCKRAISSHVGLNDTSKTEWEFQVISHGKGFIHKEVEKVLREEMDLLYLKNESPGEHKKGKWNKNNKPENNFDHGLSIDPSNTYPKKTKGPAKKNKRTRSHMNSNKKWNGGSKTKGRTESQEEATNEETVPRGRLSGASIEDGRSCLPSVKEYQWFYCGADNKRQFFDDGDDDHESTQLERDYRHNKASSSVKGMDIHFSTMMATLKDDVKQFYVCRCELLNDKGVICPSFWTGDKLAKLKKKEKDYAAIEEAFREEDELIITKIERVQNREMYSKFMSKKLGSNVKDIVMWQNVDHNLKNAVVEFGCQKSLFKLKRDELGDGICFASEIAYCVDECEIKNKKSLTFVRCLVHINSEGQDKEHRGLRYPFSDESNNMSLPYVCDNMFFMVFSDAQAYPTHFVQVQADFSDE